MISIQVDPKDDTRLILSATVTILLDRILVETLSAEVEGAIRAAAIDSLKNNQEVRNQIGRAAIAKMLEMLTTVGVNS
jgi:hypothetical protein